MALNLLREIMVRNDNSGEKSTILKPLTWLISILFGGIIILSYIKADKWIIVSFFSIICIIIMLFIFSYLYCLYKDRDALRSEKFYIQKMAIEKGYYGDNISGLITSNNSKNIVNPDDSNSENSES